MSTRPRDLHASHFRPRRIRREDDSLRSGRGEAGLDLGKGVSPHDELELNRLGMAVFLGSLVMIFGTTLAAYGIFRWREGETWRVSEPFGNLLALGLATVVLVACDVFATRALKRYAEPAAARRLTQYGFLLALGYLLVQGWNWAALLRETLPGDGPKVTMEVTLFLVLTFTHAAHVLGGVIANGVVVYRSRVGGGPRRASLDLLYRYWRFLTIVWVVIAAVLIFT